MHRNTPILVGVGLVSQRLEDPAVACEPLALMIDATVSAAVDADAPALLRQVDHVSVPKGRWRYRDPGRAIADAVGAVRATTLMASVGVLQETLIGRACRDIVAGESRVALVVGGEAGHRLARAGALGHELSDAQQESRPDISLRPTERIMTTLEVDAGLGEGAVAYYAIIDSAFRVAAGIPLDRHQDRVAELYSGFSRAAVDNPEAWIRSFTAPEVIRHPATGNPVLAFPYARLHVSNWSVDQASALLLCSVDAALEAGVPRDRWIFPLASVVSDHMVPISERELLHRSPGAEIAARRAFDAANSDPTEISVADLYSCFPVAVLTHAAAAGLPGDLPLTVTGGMPFAGGPFNNYVLHATGQVARRLRVTTDGKGLVSSVSGVLTKHGFGLWGRRPPPSPFEFVDVTAATAAATPTLPVDANYTGPGTIAGYTVLHDRRGPAVAVAVIDTPDRTRTVASAVSPDLLVELGEAEGTGRCVEIEHQDRRFRLGQA